LKIDGAGGRERLFLAARQIANLFVRTVDAADVDAAVQHIDRDLTHHR
jgi:hypothetical protein